MNSVQTLTVEFETDCFSRSDTFNFFKILDEHKPPNAKCNVLFRLMIYKTKKSRLRKFMKLCSKRNWKILFCTQVGHCLAHYFSVDIEVNHFCVFPDYSDAACTLVKSINP